MTTATSRNGHSLLKIATTSKGLPNRMLLHAIQKWGKTSFAAQAPSPIFQMTRGEDGLETLITSGVLKDTAHFEDPAKTWNELMMNIDALLIDEHSFKTFVLDTINGAERLCHEHVMAKEFEGKQEKFDAYGKGPKFAIAEFVKLLEKLDQLRSQKRMAIIVLAHSQVKTFNNPDGPNYDRWEPVLNKETMGIVDRWVDMILFGEFETFSEKETKSATKGKATGGKVRIMHTERSAAFDAGNRYNLPAEIECGDSPKEAWANFLTALHPNRKK